MVPLLDMQHVEVSYNGRAVVQDVSLQVEPGEILGIVGESGSGKSTVIRAAMGLLGNGGAVTRGDIYYKGQNVVDADEEELRKMRGPAMGMIFQNTEASLCPIRTVGDQLYESVSQHEKVSRKEVRERALEHESARKGEPGGSTQESAGTFRQDASERRRPDPEQLSL